MRKNSFDFNTGDVFGFITLTGKSSFKQEKGGRRFYVEGRCECGDVKDYLLKYLKYGNTKSCGCKRRENSAKAVMTHGLSNHPLYAVYQDMKTRCYSPAHIGYENYGGRGICICEEWLDDIFSFRAWAMSNGYEKGLQIDRIDNDGNYCPENCRFVTKDENNVNTRRNVYIECWGERKTITDWSKDVRCVVNFSTLNGRRKIMKWDFEKAMTTPKHAETKSIIREKQGRFITAWGESKTTMDWVEDERCKIGKSGLKIRLQKGWSAEDAISTPPLRK